MLLMNVLLLFGTFFQEGCSSEVSSRQTCQVSWSTWGQWSSCINNRKRRSSYRYQRRTRSQSAACIGDVCNPNPCPGGCECFYSPPYPLPRCYNKRTGRPCIIP